MFVPRRRRKLALIAVIVVLILICIIPSRKPSVDHRKPLFIAGNFWNNAQVLPHITRSILQLCEQLGPDNVFVSVYENGSQDKTPQLLVEFARDLSRMGVKHRIQTLNGDSDKFIRRISYMAAIRNKALEPLTAEYKRILFVNDVLWQPWQVLQLLAVDADAVCGLDYYNLFYDTFATRELYGQDIETQATLPPSGHYPYFQHKKRLTEVYSCWNGLIVMDAQPFVDQIKFRAVLPDSTDPPFDASECCLIFSDWRTLKPDLKVYVDTSIIFYYDTTDMHRKKTPWHHDVALWFLYVWQHLRQRADQDLFREVNGTRFYYQESFDKAVSLEISANDRVCIQ